MIKRLLPAIILASLVCEVTCPAVAESATLEFHDICVVTKECVATHLNSSVRKAPSYYDNIVARDGSFGPEHFVVGMHILIRQIDRKCLSGNLDRKNSHAGFESIPVHALGFEGSDFFIKAASIPQFGIPEKPLNGKIEILRPLNAVIYEANINFDRKPVAYFPSYLRPRGGDTCSLTENLIFSGQLGECFGCLCLIRSGVNHCLSLGGRGLHFLQLGFSGFNSIPRYFNAVLGNYERNNRYDESNKGEESCGSGGYGRYPFRCIHLSRYAFSLIIFVIAFASMLAAYFWLLFAVAVPKGVKFGWWFDRFDVHQWSPGRRSVVALAFFLISAVLIIIAVRLVLPHHDLPSPRPLNQISSIRTI